MAHEQARPDRDKYITVLWQSPGLQLYSLESLGLPDCVFLSFCNESKEYQTRHGGPVWRALWRKQRREVSHDMS